MYLYVAQDYAGNIYVTDDRDGLPPDVTNFNECHLPELKPEFISDDPTMTIEVQDYNEIVSITRGGMGPSA